MRVKLDGKTIRIEEVTWDMLMDARCTMEPREDPGKEVNAEILNAASRALWVSLKLFDAKFLHSLIDQMDRTKKPDPGVWE